MTYEDSVLYTYFSEQKILMIIFKEPYKPKSKEKIPLTDDIFVGFKLLTFPDLFINKYGKKLWDDTRDKILNHKLVVLDCHKKTGEPIITPQTKKIKSAPNWMKKSENPFFFRGSGHNSEDKYKTEVVNGIHMYPQNIWIDGKYIVNQLNLVEEVKIKNSI